MAPTTRRRPGRPAQPVSRDYLIAQATLAFSEGGFAGTSMAMLAERTGLRKASLFHHFASKDALYDEVITVALGDLASLLPTLDAKTPWVSSLDLLGERVIDHLSAHPHVARLLMREILGGGLMARRGDLVLAVVRAVSAFLEAGMQRGAIPRADPSQMAMALIGLHLTWYAAPDLSEAISSTDITSDEARVFRRAQVLPMIRAMCGVRSPSDANG